MDPVPRPTLSVVFAATHDSPTLREALPLHRSALRKLGGDLLLADGTLDGLSEEIPVSLHIPGADVFALRAAAAAQARGEVVAFTEDHCLPDDRWHENILRAHKHHREVLTIGGAVLNGSPTSKANWANFLMTFGPFLPPLPLRYEKRPVPPANVSIKRDHLEIYDLKSGQIELEILPHLHRTGNMVLDDSIRVRHVQSGTVLDFIRSHFHNGRSSAALPVRKPPLAEKSVRAFHSFVLPWRLLRQLHQELRRKSDYKHQARTAAPLVVIFAFAHAAGELVGILLGPGASPGRLE